jgi:hypothetical protein
MLPFYDESRRLAQHRSPVADYRQHIGGFSGERIGTLPLHPQCQECQQASLRIPSSRRRRKLFGSRMGENVIGNMKGKSNLAAEAVQALKLIRRRPPSWRLASKAI